MLNVNIAQLKSLIRKEKANSLNPKRPKYSAAVIDAVREMTRHMSELEIEKALGLSRTFIRRQKDISSKKKVLKSDDQLHFLQIPEQLNSFVNDASPATLAMRFNMPNGISIEIFS